MTTDSEKQKIPYLIFFQEEFVVSCAFGSKQNIPVFVGQFQSKAIGTCYFASMKAILYFGD